MLLNPYRFPSAPPSTLLTGIVAYWKMDESSGDATDIVGGNNLTSTNSVGGGYTGKYGTSRHFNGSNQLLSRTSGTALSTGDIDFTFAAWVRATADFVGSRGILGKWNTSNQMEFQLMYDQSPTRYAFRVINQSQGSQAYAAAPSGSTPPPGAWALVIGWHDSVANVVAIVVNTTTPVTTAHSLGVASFTANPFYIGRAGDLSYWNGQIDEVGFWKRVLTSTERTELWNSGFGKTYPFSTPDYVAPPVVDLRSGLVSYWKLNEASGDALDAHGPNTLTNTNSVGTAAGKIGTARSFAAASSRYFVKTPAGTDLSIPDNTSFTFSAWANATAWGTVRHTIVSKWGATVDLQEFRIYYDYGSSYRMAFQVSNGYQTVNLASTIAIPTAGTWFHIACWYDVAAKQIGISINNQTANTVAYTGSFNGSSTIPFWIGRENTAYWDGLIDEVGFWKRALSAAERTQLYNSGNGLAYPFTSLLANLVSYWKLDEASGQRIDSHGTNHLTDNASNVSGIASKIGNGADFSGAGGQSTTQFLTCASNASLQTGNIDQTFTAWVKFDAAPPAGLHRTILSKDNANNLREILLVWEQAANKFGFAIGAGNSSVEAVYANSFGTPSLGVWYFVVAGYNATTDKAFIQINNGVVDEATIVLTPGVSTNPFIIGAEGFSSFRIPHDGLIDEVGFWKRILTADERTALYNGGNGLTYPFT